ncbi:hypothetical protein [Mucilaginibacter sp. KACC 22063]|uniref:hypothetical protein n=1 Tax=Mucilaginibacter sp. KACC 22063 TaxID=3025666 RepID=UPI0023650DB6|nr:hypothetical protein [Mucilaginibacter sp. KACC 22063]WDF54249.1 hypothetical protein PQ461_14980 [Mucilaginibacter sp. KACC 22063]
MKKLTAILLLTVFLFSTTELHQLLKLPMVFEHFAEHRKENKSISFLQFLDMHYMHGSPRDKDYSEDMKLPFKTADNCMAAISPVVVPQVLPALTFPVIYSAETKLEPLNSGFNYSVYLSGIWQPPKFC